MTSSWPVVLCVVAVVVCGLVSGVFLVFSDFVMRALKNVDTVSAIKTMQSINRCVYRSVFVVLIMAMAGMSLILVVLAFFNLQGPAPAWLIAGGSLYLIGAFLITIVFNVPMNKRLDRMQPEAVEAASYWRTYTSSWTMWNHVRSVASLGSTLCFLIASVLMSTTLAH